MLLRTGRPTTKSSLIANQVKAALFELADLGKSPLAVEAVRRIEAIFAIEREIEGIIAEQRLAVRQEPLVCELEGWMLSERARLSRRADIAKAGIHPLSR